MRTCHSPQPCPSLLPAGPGKAAPGPFPKQAGRPWAPGHGQRLQPKEQASMPLNLQESALTPRQLQARPAEPGEKARCLVRLGRGRSCNTGQLPRARNSLLTNNKLYQARAPSNLHHLRFVKPSGSVAIQPETRGEASPDWVRNLNSGILKNHQRYLIICKKKNPCPSHMAGDILGF